MRQQPVTRRKSAMMTRTEPSSSFRKDSAMFMSSSESVDRAASWRVVIAGVPREDEPNLYNIPEGIFPTYRPLPIVVKLLVGLLSVFLSALTTWHNLTWMTPLAAVRGRETLNPRKLLSFLVKTISVGLLSGIVLQDAFLRPSRISTATLLRDFCPPSTLSNYEPVILPSGKSLGVHYLKYKPAKQDGPHSFRAVYVNHGFGASSLSWLPALPTLVDRVGARVGLGHDAPGFGFTDRARQNRTVYSIQSSAEIGSTLLSSVETFSEDTSNAVVLVGHSMGAIATLRMALALPTETVKRVILVAPALGFRTHSTTSRPVSVQRLADWTRPVRGFVGRWVLDPVWSYVLRRVVGRENFWKNSLKLAWGDPEKVSDSDALRFQWPSIGKGWERGLLAFAGTQLQPPPDKLSDEQLMERVLLDKNTRVAVIRGTADRVVPKGGMDKFLEPFAGNVTLVELNGHQGHDPFEEQVETFVDAVEKILADFSNA